MRHLNRYIREFMDLEVLPNGFLILKPGFYDHVEDIDKWLKDHGWEVWQKETVLLSFDQCRALYRMHKDKEFYEDLIDYMHSGPCTIYKIWKECDDPIEEIKDFKDEIRQKWGIDDMRNVLHSSDSLSNVLRESRICFGE